MLKKIFLLVILVVLVAALVGCQTVQGFGKDIEWTGQKGAEAISGE